MKLSFKNKKKAIPPEQIKKKAAQDWLPFQDVTSSFLCKKDGSLSVCLRVEPINITLKSENEKRRIISAMHEAINGQVEPLQIFCLPRPVDLDSYLDILQRQARDLTDLTRKKLLLEYIQYVATVVKGGEAIEHRYYIQISQKPSKHIKEDLYQKAHELASNLSKCGLQITVCDDAAILDMLFSFLQPAQAAFEFIPLVAGISTLYDKES